MTALTPHIRVLRAEAEALRKEAKDLREKGASETGAVEMLTAALVLAWTASAKDRAADALEADELALAEGLGESEVEYNPKGRKP